MNVFVVEDSRAIRHLLVRRLEDLPGARVVGEADREAQAIALIEWTRADTVLLDLHLANGGLGLNVLRQLRRRRFAGRILVISNQGLEAYREACLAAGADAYYDKSHDVDRLFDDLAALIDTARGEADGDEHAVAHLQQLIAAGEDDGLDLAVCVVDGRAALPAERLGLIELATGLQCLVLRADAAAPVAAGSLALFPADALGARALLNLARARAAGVRGL